MMTNEMIKKLENKVTVFNHFVVGSNDIAMMIEANTNRLNHIVEAKLALAMLVKEIESLGYIVEIKTNNGFISNVIWTK